MSDIEHLYLFTLVHCSLLFGFHSTVKYSPFCSSSVRTGRVCNVHYVTSYGGGGLFCRGLGWIISLKPKVERIAGNRRGTRTLSEHFQGTLECPSLGCLSGVHLCSLCDQSFTFVIIERHSVKSEALLVGSIKYLILPSYCWISNQLFKCFFHFHIENRGAKERRAVQDLR